VLEPELLELMTETVSIRTWIAQTPSGAPSYNPVAQTFPARIQLKSTMVRLKDGREVVARGLAYLAIASLADVPSDADELTLPAGYDPQVPPILAVQTEMDEGSLHHVVVVLG
jgi:hypothetical protein